MRVRPNVSKRLVIIVPTIDSIASRRRKRLANRSFNSPRAYMNGTQQIDAMTTAPVQKSRGSRLTAPHRVRAGCPAPIKVLAIASATPILNARPRVSPATAPPANGATAVVESLIARLSPDRGYRGHEYRDRNAVPDERLIGAGAHESHQESDRDKAEHGRRQESPSNGRVQAA